MENLTKNPKICEINKRIILENSCRSWKTFQNRAFNKTVGPGNKSKIEKPRA